MAKNSCQKKPIVLEILGTKVVQFLYYTKLIKTKKLFLNWYFSTKIFLRKIQRIFNIENGLWKSDFGPFWCLFLEKINTIFVISAIIASIWNVFIKFRWHDEKLTAVYNTRYDFTRYFPNFQSLSDKKLVNIKLLWQKSKLYFIKVLAPLCVYLLLK